MKDLTFTLDGEELTAEEIVKRIGAAKKRHLLHLEALELEAKAKDAALSYRLLTAGNELLDLAAGYMDRKSIDILDLQDTIRYATGILFDLITKNKGAT